MISYECVFCLNTGDLLECVPEGNVADGGAPPGALDTFTTSGSCYVLHI